MTKSILAGALCVALSLSGLSATPAQAETSDFTKALAAIAAFALLTNALNADQNGNHNPPPRPEPQRLERLPAACVVQTWTRRGPDHALSVSCVERVMRHPGRLPDHCLTRAEVVPYGRNNRHSDRGRSHGNQRSEVFDITCLRNAGYRFDR